MKLLTAALASSALIGSTALAGSYNEPTIEAPVIVAETTNSSGGVAIPLLMAAMVLYVAIATGGAVAGPVVSDARLKDRVVPTGRSVNGIPIYHFSYKGDARVWEGVMAQDVLRSHPQAVMTLENGYYAVDYDRIGFQMTRIH